MGGVMSDPNEKSPESKKSRGKLRLVSALIGIVIMAVVGVVVMNMVASKANGADSETATAEGEDQTAAKEGEEENGKAPVPVEVAQIGVGSVSAYISSTANLVAENDVKVLAEAEGRVATLLVEEGDAIRKGQLLATLVQDDEENPPQESAADGVECQAVLRAGEGSRREGAHQSGGVRQALHRLRNRLVRSWPNREWAKDRTEIRALPSAAR